MKNILHLFAFLLLAVCAISSCIKNEDVVTAPECYIISMSVADIKSAIATKNSKGEDTIVYRTIGGNSVYFNIDQVKNTITSVDSLPVWVDLSKVVPTVNSYGYVYYKHEQDTLFMPLLSGNDSIDFTSPVDFLVIGTDGVSTKQYKVKINKSESEMDSLLWNKVEQPNLQIEGNHRMLYFANRLYVFANNGGNTTVTSSSLLSEGRSWSVPAQTTGVENGTIDYSSTTVYGDKIYALGTDGRLYASTSDARGVTWNKVSERIFTCLLGADEYYFYASDGMTILTTQDMQNWTKEATADFDMLPQTCIHTVSYVTRTNADMQSVVMAGLNDNDNEHAVVWYKISSETPNSNQKWDYINVTEENEYGCPKLKELNIIYYKGMLLAIGGQNMADDKSVAYDGIYCSQDNGITWKKITGKIMLPESVIGTNIATSAATDGNHIWLVRSNGEVWRGLINKSTE